jgi:uncharacterized membrane protein
LVVGFGEKAVKRTATETVQRILRAIAMAWAAASLLAIASAPAIAHKKPHQPEQQAEQSRNQAAHENTGNAATRPGTVPAAHGSMGEMMEHRSEDRSQMSFAARLLDWIGRLHPSIVHFPIAFFPAAAFTAIVGRRREAFGTPVRFLVITGGIIAPIAAIMGWLDAMGEEPSTLLTVHRWLGTSVGIGGLLLAIWAWRRPDQDRSAGMIVALLLITAAIVVQGWYGGAIVHGR